MERYAPENIVSKVMSILEKEYDIEINELGFIAEKEIADRIPELKINAALLAACKGWLKLFIDDGMGTEINGMVRKTKSAIEQTGEVT